MTKSNKNIQPGIGLGSVKFGMTRDQVEAILGEPGEKEMFSYTGDDDDIAELWHYDELELSASFDEEDDWRLVTLSVTGEDYLLEDMPVIGLTQEALRATLLKMDIDDLEYEDLSSAENPSHELIASDDYGLNFWLDNGIVSEIQWIPDFLDDENIDWPE